MSKQKIVVIGNGRVVDGTGAPWFRADVGVTGDRITAVAEPSSLAPDDDTEVTRVRVSKW